ncbi:MAG: hypothetical protein NTV25_08630 [Methanothrix sp.]|nr:hypothetical protein [Methanothrix sp.]
MKEITSYSKIWRMKAIDDLCKDKRNLTEPIDYIYGECSDTITIGYASSKGLAVRLVSGNRIRNSMSRDRLAYLKRKYGEMLTVISLGDRPPRHAVRIGKSILLEDRHSSEKAYEGATVLDEATELILSRFDKYIRGLIDPYDKKGLDENGILGLELLEND